MKHKTNVLLSLSGTALLLLGLAGCGKGTPDKTAASPTPVPTQAAAMEAPPVQDELTESSPTPTPTAAPAGEETAVDGIRPEFKQALDDYEAFFDEYYAFMEKHQASDGTSLTLLADYSSFLARYADTMESMETLGSEEDLTTEELQYYLEVTTRIQQKLLEVAG